MDKPIRNPEQYASAALERAVDDVAASSPGERNNILNRAAVGLYSLAYGGAVDLATVDQALTEAARSAGLDLPSIRATLRSARRAGERNPRRIDQGTASSWRPGRNTTARRPAPDPTPEPPPKRPPQDELNTLWAACLPMDYTGESKEAADVAFFLQRKKLWQPGKMARHDLCRILPPAPYELPAWCACTVDVAGGFRGGMKRRERRSWRQAGYYLVLPAYDATGRLASVHARYAGPPPGPKERKTLWPSGYQVRGLTFANPPALAMLRGELPEAPARVVIAEGATDYLLAALKWPALPILGLTAGTWNRELADRVPDGATVAIRTDNDPAGDRYAETVIESFKGRRVALVRTRREKKP